MKIDLTSRERLLLLDALSSPCYLDKISNPATPFFIRQMYKALKERLQEDEMVHQEIKESLKPKEDEVKPLKKMFDKKGDN